jgi:exosortase
MTSWPAAGTVAVIALAHLALVAMQSRLSWEHPHYRFFPIAMLGAGLLVARDGRRLGRLEPGPDRRAVPLLAVAWALLAVACLLGSPWLGSVAAMVAALAVADAIGGAPLLRAVLPAWVLLCLTIPPPLGLDEMLIARLQTAATSWSSRVLDLLGVFHAREGHVIRLADRRLLIEEACSGVHSLFAVLAGTTFLAIWARRSTGRTIALVVAAVGWVVLGNTLRIVAVTHLAARWQIDATTGWVHEALGVAVFALALGLTASTDALLSIFGDVRRLLRARERAMTMSLDAIPPASEPIIVSIPTRLPDLRRTWLGSWRLAASYGVLLAVQPLLLRPLLEDYFLPGSVVASRLLALRADDLPASSGPFVREGFRTSRRDLMNNIGRFSQTWSYRWGRRAVAVSVDGPFLGWHDLSACYFGQGWTTPETSSAAEGEAPGGPFVTAGFVRPPDQRGDLFFILSDTQGRVLDPPGRGGLLGYVADRLTFWRTRRTYQVQVFVEGATPLTASERDQAEAFFREARSRLVPRLGPDGREASP